VERGRGNNDEGEEEGMTMTKTTISNHHSTPNPTMSNCSQGGKGEQREGTMTRSRGEDNEAEGQQ